MKDLDVKKLAARACFVKKENNKIIKKAVSDLQAAGIGAGAGGLVGLATGLIKQKSLKRTLMDSLLYASGGAALGYGVNRARESFSKKDKPSLGGIPVEGQVSGGTPGSGGGPRPKGPKASPDTIIPLPDTEARYLNFKDSEGNTHRVGVFTGEDGITLADRETVVPYEDLKAMVEERGFTGLEMSMPVDVKELDPASFWGGAAANFLLNPATSSEQTVGGVAGGLVGARRHLGMLRRESEQLQRGERPSHKSYADRYVLAPEDNHQKLTTQTNRLLGAHNAEGIKARISPLQQSLEALEARNQVISDLVAGKPVDPARVAAHASDLPASFLSRAHDRAEQVARLQRINDGFLQFSNAKVTKNNALVRNNDGSINIPSTLNNFKGERTAGADQEAKRNITEYRQTLQDFAERENRGGGILGTKGTKREGLADSRSAVERVNVELTRAATPLLSTADIDRISAEVGAAKIDEKKTFSPAHQRPTWQQGRTWYGRRTGPYRMDVSPDLTIMANNPRDADGYSYRINGQEVPNASRLGAVTGVRQYAHTAPTAADLRVNPRVLGGVGRAGLGTFLGYGLGRGVEAMLDSSAARSSNVGHQGAFHPAAPGQQNFSELFR